MKELIGTTLGQYEIREKIGQGGMAHVFKAFQPGLNRFVAIKVLPPALAEEAGFTERFQREAQSIARLHHRASKWRESGDLHPFRNPEAGAGLGGSFDFLSYSWSRARSGP